MSDERVTAEEAFQLTKRQARHVLDVLTDADMDRCPECGPIREDLKGWLSRWENRTEEPRKALRPMQPERDANPGANDRADLVEKSASSSAASPAKLHWIDEGGDYFHAHEKPDSCALEDECGDVVLAPTYTMIGLRLPPMDEAKAKRIVEATHALAARLGGEEGK